MQKNMFPTPMKIQVKTTILNGLYNTGKVERHKQIEALCVRQMALTATNVPGFGFNGVLYGQGPMWKVRLLHEELVTTMEAILEKEELVYEEEEVLVSSMIQVALNRCWHPADMYLMITPELHRYLPDVEFHDQATVSHESAKAFREKYSHVSDMIKVRLMTNMILE